MRITLTQIALKLAKDLSLRHHKRLVYRSIVQDDFRVIIGLCVEPRPDEQFSIHSFIQALYIPFPGLEYNLGNRIGYWNREKLPEAICDSSNYFKIYTHYTSIETIIDSIVNHQLIYRCGTIIYKYEFLAYSYIVIKQYTYAKEYLKKILAFESDEHFEWFKDVILRAKILLELMEAVDQDGIKKLLLTWQKETMTALKLPECSV